MWLKLFKNSRDYKTSPIFDPLEWEKKVAKLDWHLEVPALMKELSKLHDHDRAMYDRTIDQIYTFFERQLKQDKVALATTGEAYDTARQPIDTIIIHHTSQKPGLTKDRLSALDLFRLYAPQYAVKEPVVGVYSGHFRYGIQVFWPYHWIVRRNGTCERLLEDREVGWQAGNWDVNCKSVAIVLDGDYEDSEPSEAELRAIVKLIKENYPDVPRDNILGHCEVNKKTACPSRRFMGDDTHKGWKDRLLAMI